MGSLPPSPRRVFGSSSFLRLWIAQVVSSFGDWIGLFALIAVAGRVSPGPESVGLVMAARVAPGFFLAPLGGVLVDRWDRRRTMFFCDLGRGLVVALIPFVDTVGGLIVASFGLEIFTLLWSPAKEASVPNLVPPEKLAAANSLSVAAAYGTFPVASAAFALLATLAAWLGGFDALSRLEVNQESLALWFDAATFLTSAALILTLKLPTRELPTRGQHKDEHVEWMRPLREIADGWRFIRSHELVRGVMIGFAGGLIGGGSLVPLSRDFVDVVLDAGNAGYGLLLTALGTGGAIGVITIPMVNRRIARDVTFTAGIVAVGIGIGLAASMGALTAAVVLLAFVGFAAGGAYVSGVTILQEEVADELRGRTFSTLYTLVRFCLLLSLTVAPLAAGALDSLSKRVFDDRTVDLFGVSMFMPGVRMTLLIGGAIILAAGVVASIEVRRGRRKVA